MLELGAGTIEDLYIYPIDMIGRFDGANGKIAGFVQIATDILGNHFAFNPNGQDPDLIYYCSHDPLGFGICAENIVELLRRFVASGFQIVEITDDIDLEDF